MTRTTLHLKPQPNNDHSTISPAVPRHWNTTGCPVHSRPTIATGSALPLHQRTLIGTPHIQSNQHLRRHQACFLLNNLAVAVNHKNLPTKKVLKMSCCHSECSLPAFMPGEEMAVWQWAMEVNLVLILLSHTPQMLRHWRVHCVPWQVRTPCTGP
jgi:hypothetical protein